MEFLILMFLFGVWLTVSPMLSDIQDLADDIYANTRDTRLPETRSGKAHLKETRRTFEGGKVNEIIREADIPYKD